MNYLPYNAYREIKYIYWRKEAEIITLTQEQFRDKYLELDSKRTKVKYSSIRANYTDSTYSIKVDGNYKMLFFWNSKYFIYSTNSYDSNKNLSSEYEGSEAIKTLSSEFKARNNISMVKAFGTVEESFKRCVPKQFYYLSQNYLNKELVASSLDACSQYPSCMCGRLPDSHTMIEVKGRVEPNEEYPFAFYKSGHVAEYGVFDTHNWRFNYFFKQLFRYTEYISKNGQKWYNWPIQPCKDDDEVTYLMKASKYTFTEVWNDFYSKRDIDEKAKLVMNSAIGMMHTRKYKNYKYAHLVAIAIARGNQKILDKADIIGYNNIIQICVDGIIYKGKAIGVDFKKLGAFHQEFTNCDFKISNFNKYIAMEGNKCVKAKHGNCNTDITEDKDIVSLDDQYKWKLVNPLEGVDDETL